MSDNTHSIFRFTKKKKRKKRELDNTHTIFSITKHGSQTIHTASSASQ